MSTESKSKNTMLGLLFVAGLVIIRMVARFLIKPATAVAKADALQPVSAAAPAAAVAPAAPRLMERDADRTVEPNKGLDRSRRERWGTIIVFCCMIVGLASGCGFVYAYWSNANTSILGGTLALSVAGLGVALVFWAHLLMSHKEAIEAREPIQSALAERQLLLLDLDAGKHDVRRRSLLTWMCGAFGAVFVASIASLFRSLGAAPERSLHDTIWKSGQRLMTPEGTPVSIHALQPGSTMVVFPEDSIGDEKAQTVLVRVDEQFLKMPKERTDWAPLGYLAYSRVCTHAGCPVALYQKQSHLLLCPCHQSTFDVLNGAQPTSGPAARSLPQVPLYADSDGTLRAGGGFSTPPGPGFWGMPA